MAATCTQWRDDPIKNLVAALAIPSFLQGSILEILARTSGLSSGRKDWKRMLFPVSLIPLSIAACRERCLK